MKNGEDKYYFFPITNKYPRLFKKISSTFEFDNKNLMKKLDKILAVVTVVKNPLKIISANNFEPILLNENQFDEIAQEENNQINYNRNENIYDQNLQNNLGK